MNIHTLADLYDRCITNEWQGQIIEHDTHSELNACHLKHDAKNWLDEIEAAGIIFGDRVILKTQNTCTIVTAMIALWKKGAILIPVKDNISNQMLEKIAENCHACFVISCSPKVTITKLHHVYYKNDIFLIKTDRHVSGCDLALIIYTSGSTGRAKGIMLTHNNIISALNSICDYLNILSDDTILCFSPLSFDYGLYQVLFSFKTNCTVVLYHNAINPIRIAQVVKQHHVTILPMVPVIATAFERSLHLLTEYFSTVKKITNTGGHLTEKTIIGLRNKLPKTKIYAMYGLTESKRVFYLPPQDIDKKVGSVGIPMPGLEAKIFNVSKNKNKILHVETDPYEVGTLFIRGPSIMQGYTQQQSDEHVYIVQGDYREDIWLSTGDLFYRDADGYHYFKGRIKELIKQASYCIYPKEIEDIVNKHPDVYFNAVVGDKDENNNEIAHLFIQLEKDEKIIRQTVELWLRSQLTEEYRPKKITFIDDVPISTNGKIDKNEFYNRSIRH